MRTIYIIRRPNHSYRYGGRSRGWLNRNNWYNAGYIFGFVIQFIASIGIGWLVGIVLRALGII